MSAPAIRAWDLPTRIFHWSFALLVTFSFATGTVGGDLMEWHLKSGYAVIALLLFRIAWGFVGSDTARFARFLRGPRSALAYARSAVAGAPPRVLGHTPLGGWMVVAMLVAIATQAVSGLFADDEIATRGPLADLVSDAMVHRMGGIHETVRWIVMALVALHVSAIATYRLAWNVRLTGSMWHGRSEADGDPQPRERPIWVALLIAIACAAVVYTLVVVYPGGF